MSCAKGYYCASRPNSVGKALRVCDVGANCFKNNDAFGGKCSVTFCDGIAVQGSINQPRLNGCYQDRNISVSGVPSYKNSREVLLHWQKTEEVWCLGTRVGKCIGRAIGSGEAGPGAVQANLWMTFSPKTRTWQFESLIFSSGACSML